MTVQQFLIFDNDTEQPIGAVASDGDTAKTVYSDGFPDNDELREDLAANFVQKVEVAADLEDWPLMEVLRYNLHFMTGPVEEYESFEAAAAAAQEAFGD